MYCELGDCNKYTCHHCFPVRNCSYEHAKCKTDGVVKEMQIILVTGCAGFIGSHVCEKLLKNDEVVIGIDNMIPYYDPAVKKKNLEILKKYKKFFFEEDDIRSTQIIEKWRPYKIIHLASMAGVRYSIENPKLYVQVNIEGFVHILEEAVKYEVKHIVYASSSSVYGLNEVPFLETDNIMSCNSQYACSKMVMELFAKTYTQLYDKLSCIGLRFFTVYGPRGRPDMAPYKFLNAIRNGEPIQRYGDGSTTRDYTYVGDIVDGILGALKNKNNRKCEVYNLGNSNPVSLNTFIETCERVCGKKACIIEKPHQLGDVPHTYACIDKARMDLEYEPKMSLEDGLRYSIL
jgi:UDP-glucuronate 4-epimerase